MNNITGKVDIKDCLQTDQKTEDITTRYSFIIFYAKMIWIWLKKNHLFHQVYGIKLELLHMPRRVVIIVWSETVTNYFLNLSKKSCQTNRLRRNNSDVWSIEDYYEIRNIIHESLPRNEIRRLWTRNKAINTTHYYDDLGIYEFSR